MHSLPTLLLLPFPCPALMPCHSSCALCVEFCFNTTGAELRRAAQSLSSHTVTCAPSTTNTHPQASTLALPLAHLLHLCQLLFQQPRTLCLCCAGLWRGRPAPGTAPGLAAAWLALGRHRGRPVEQGAHKWLPNAWCLPFAIRITWLSNASLVSFIVLCEAQGQGQKQACEPWVLAIKPELSITVKLRADNVTWQLASCWESCSSSKHCFCTSTESSIALLTWYEDARGGGNCSNDGA